MLLVFWFKLHSVYKVAVIQSQHNLGSWVQLKADLKAFSLSVRVLRLTAGLLRRWQDGCIWFSIKMPVMAIDCLLLFLPRVSFKEHLSWSISLLSALMEGVIRSNQDFPADLIPRAATWVMKLGPLMMIGT